MWHTEHYNTGINHPVWFSISYMERYMFLAFQRKQILAGIMICMLSGQLSAMNSWQRITTASAYVQAFDTAKQFWQTRSKTTKAVGVFALSAVALFKIIQCLYAKQLQTFDSGFQIFPNVPVQSPYDKSIILYVHGFGDDKMGWQHSLHIRKFKHLAIFNFPDHNLGKSLFFKQSSLAQWSDMRELLKALKAIITQKPQLEKIVIYAISRGAGTTINALAVLNDPAYKTLLEKECGITEADKYHILNLIQAGFLYLQTPYTDLKPIIQSKIAFVRKRLISDRSWMGAVCSIPESLLASLVVPFASLLLWQRSYFGPEPIESVKKLEGLNLTTLLYFAGRDTLVTNANDRLLYERFKQRKIGKTYVIKGKFDDHNGPISSNVYGQAREAFLFEAFNALLDQVYGNYSTFDESCALSDSLQDEYYDKVCNPANYDIPE